MRSIFVAGALASLAGCHAERVLALARAPDGGADTGHAAGQPFRAPKVVAGLRGDAYDVQDPSMTFEELELYFTAPSAGLNDIWVARRTLTTDPWGAGALVAELSSPQNDEDPEVSVDGLTMVFASDRGGDGMRLFVSQRRTRDTPWEAPTRVDGLGASALDLAPAMDRAQLSLVFASQRGAASTPHLYSATRPDASSAWRSAVEITALTSASRDTDPALFAEGRGLVFASSRSSESAAMDLFQTARSDVSSPFAAGIAPLAELNTSSTEQDPWVSQDGRHILFVSDRDGRSRIYESTR